MTFVSVHYSDAEHPLAYDFEGDILHFKFQFLNLSSLQLQKNRAKWGWLAKHSKTETREDLPSLSITF